MGSNAPTHAIAATGDIPTISMRAGDVHAVLNATPTTRASPPMRATRSAKSSSAAARGEVVRVYDRQLRRHLVMKQLNVDHVVDPISVARFVQEAQITAQLQHPNIVPVHDIGTRASGQPYYTMAEVRGRTFASVIAAVHAAASTNGWGVEAGGFGFRRLIDIFERVCEAVGYAHACGVVHRDLKPQNIMLGAFGEALVLDWGARARDRAARAGRRHAADADALADPDDEPARRSRARAEAGTIVGTYGYMSPEQRAGDDDIGPASDVFALGMMLREILAGRPPNVPERLRHPRSDPRDAGAPRCPTS